VRKLRDESGSEDVYFTFEDSSKTSSSNLTFVTFTGVEGRSREENDSIFDEISLLIAQRETSMMFDYDKDLLWRMIIFRADYSSLKNISESETYRYWVVITCHHAIFDGRSGFLSTLQLFEVFEKMYAGNFARAELTVIPPSSDDLFKDKFKPRTFHDVTFPTVPKLLNPEKANTTKLALSERLSESELGNLLLDNDEGPFMTLGELIDFCARYNSKSATFTLKGAPLLKLLELCKRENAKFNACADLILSLAMKRIYPRHFAEPCEDVIFGNSVALRQFLSNSELKENPAMGMLISHYLFSQKVDFSEVDFSREFWQAAREFSNNLHERLKNLDFETLDFDELRDEQMFFHFYFSNVGTIPTSFARQPLLKLKRMFGFRNNRYVSKKLVFYGMGVTVDGEFNLSLMYNSAFYPTEAIHDYVNTLQEIVDKLSADA